MDPKSCGNKLGKNGKGGEIWKVKDLKNAPVEKAREIQEIQTDQVYLKSLEKEENRKMAGSRGAVAMQLMRLERMQKEQPIRQLEEARFQSSLLEKERARRVAMKPPLPQEVPPLLEKRKVADFYDTNFLSTWTKECNIYQAERSLEKGSAVRNAVLQKEKREQLEVQHFQELEKRDNVANKRYQAANQKERTHKDYNIVIGDLELAHREEIARKQKALVMRPVKKRDVGPYTLTPRRTNQEKTLEKNVETLLFTDKGSHVRSNQLFDKVRYERQQCMRKWRPDDGEDETPHPHLKSDFSAALESAEAREGLSPDLLNQAMNEISDDSEIFLFDEANRTVIEKSPEITSTYKPLEKEDEGLKNESDPIIKDNEKPRTDASTQTIEQSLLSISSEENKHVQSESSLDVKSTENKSSESSDLRLGSVISLPKMSEKISPTLSSLIKKTAAKTFSSSASCKYSDETKEEIGKQNGENEMPSNSVKANVLEKAKFFNDILEPSLSVTKSIRTQSFPSQTSTSQTAVVINRKVIRIQSETSTDLDGKLPSNESTPTSKTNKLFSSPSNSTNNNKNVVCQTQQDVNTIPKSTKLSDFKVTPYSNTVANNMASSKVKSKTCSRTEQRTSPAQSKTAKSDTTLSSLESQINIMNINSPQRNQTKGKTEITSTLPVVPDGVLSSKQTLIDIEYEKENVVSGKVHKPSHTDYFCKPKFFDSLVEYNNPVESNVPSNLKQLPLSRLTNLEKHQLGDISKCSSPDISSFPLSPASADVMLPGFARLLRNAHLKQAEGTDEESAKNTSNDVSSSLSLSLPSLDTSLSDLIRDSLETQLKRTELSVTSENIRLHEPPPVSFPFGIQGTENVVPHELSTIAEMDTPQNSLTENPPRNFLPAQASVSVLSIMNLLEKSTTPQVVNAAGPKGFASLSPSLSLPSSLSSWSSVLKMYSPTAASTSTTSSQLTEAFSAEKIRMHSTPIKMRDAEENTTVSNIMDQSITLVDGFSIESQFEKDTSSVISGTSKPVSSYSKMSDNCPNSKSGHPMWTQSSASSCSSLVTLSPYNPGASDKLSIPSSVESFAESESLLSFVRHEQSVLNSDAGCSFFN